MEVRLLCHLLVILPLAMSGGEECPPWFILDCTNNSKFPKCVCSEESSSYITCNQRERTSYIKAGHCAIQDEVIDHTLVGDCPYMFPPHLVHNGYIRLPGNLTDLNMFICGYLTRELGSPLCGKCANGTGPSIYSFGSHCVSCSRLNILYYLLLQYAPATIIFLAIVLLRISLVSPPMAHYILYCNVMHVIMKLFAGFYFLYISTNTYIIIVIRLLLTLNSLWTFDPLFFLSPPFCISQNFHEIYIPLLENVAALYPFALLLLTYILIELYARDCKVVVVMWKAVRPKCGCLLGDCNSDKSLIQAFATLFFLSFMRFIGIVNSTFMLSYLFNSKGQLVRKVLFIDPTVTSFSHTHLFSFIFSAVIFVLLIFPPVLLLVLFPTTCFTKVSRCLKPRWFLTLKIFVDTFHGSYKDGTNGTRDFRQVAGFIFLVWMVCESLALSTMARFFTLLPPTVGASIVFVVFQPHKHRPANISGAILPIIAILIGGILLIMSKYKFSTEMALLCIGVATLPHCVFYGYMESNFLCVYIWSTYAYMCPVVYKHYVAS